VKPRYAAASTLNLPLHFASFAGASLLVYVVVMAMLTQRFAIADGIGWTIVMCALIWRVQAVRRYEILDDRLRFVGLLGSTTLPFSEIRRVDVIEARMLYVLPIGKWRRSVQIERSGFRLSLAPGAVFVRDTDAFVRALNAARLAKPVPYSVSVQRPPRP
jgi:hypothetical protein